MTFDSRRLFDWLCPVGMLLLVVTGVGCGEGEAPSQTQKLCPSSGCEFGVCNQKRGACVNPPTCETNLDCLPGYECSEESVCKARVTCRTNSECKTGVCEGGVCVNPESCQDNGDCLAKTHCDSRDTCAYDPCNTTQCPRGVCERGTGDCISKSSCTQETQQQDCVAGQKCLDGECLSAAAYCSQMECERGVCNFQTESCRDAKDCQGDDSKCMPGKFCTSFDTCRVDQCQKLGVTCEDGGSCVRLRGECETVSPCDSSEDCLSDHVCVQGTCRLESAACGEGPGDGGCPGNKICDYDAESLAATCVEPDDCETSLDCNEGRQCAGRSCLEARACSGDALEPNDQLDDAVDFNSAAKADRLRATLCPGDTDIFGLETGELSNSPTRGQLVVDVDVAKRSVGLGRLEAKLLDEDGNLLTSSSTGDRSRAGGLELTHRVVPNAPESMYHVELSAGGEMATPGIAYDLSIGVLADKTKMACEEASRLEANAQVVGRLGMDEDSPQHAPSCLPEETTHSSNVYTFQLDRPRRVHASLIPQRDDAAFALSIRDRCGLVSTERACAPGTSGQSALNETLPAGTYSLYVTAKKDTRKGSYTLSYQLEDPYCTPGDSHCTDSKSSRFCAASGTEFKSVSCPDGCNPTTGRCHAPPGNRCAGGPTITPDDHGNNSGDGATDAGTGGEADAGYSQNTDTGLGRDADSDAGGMPSGRPGTRTIDLRRRTNAYELPAGSCLNEFEGTTQTGGPDQTYRVEVPSQTLLKTTANFSDNGRGSVYVVRNCQDLHSSCETGSTSGTTSKVSSHFLNDSSQAQSVRVIVDTAAGRVPESAEVTLEYQPIICPKGTTECGSNGNIRSCNQYGTQWTVDQSCALGCNSQLSCVGDTCANPRRINPPADGRPRSYSFMLDGFKNDYDSGGSCASGPALFPGGKDAVFAIDLNQDESLTMNWTVNDNPTLYVTTDCSDPVSSDTCPVGATAWRGSTRTVSGVSFTASSTQTYYIIADVDSIGSPPYTPDASTLTVTREAP